MPRFEPFRAASADLSLDEVLERLAARTEVLGVARLGSTAGEVAPWSDYDLLVVTADGPDFDVEFTWIEERPADVVFVSRRQLERLASGRGDSKRDANLRRWLASGRIVFSRCPELGACAEGSHREPAIEDSELFFRWVEANFDLVKARRWLSAPASYEAALEVHLATALSTVLEDYLRCRGRPWEGAKTATDFVASRDPDFLAELRAALRTTSLAEKLHRCCVLLERAFEPVGRLWQPGETAGGWLHAEGEPQQCSQWEAVLRERSDG